MKAALPLALLLSVFVACSRHHESDEIMMTVPAFSTLDGAKKAEDYSAFLGKIAIHPNRIHLTHKELENFCSVFSQLNALAESQKLGDVLLPESSDLFVAINTTLNGQPGWRILASHSRAKDGVEVTSLVAFIEARYGERTK